MWRLKYLLKGAAIGGLVGLIVGAVWNSLSPSTSFEAMVQDISLYVGGFALAGMFFMRPPIKQ